MTDLTDVPFRHLEREIQRRGYTIVRPLAADPHAEKRGPRPVDPGDRVTWEKERVAYDDATGEFQPTGERLRLSGEVRRVEVDVQNFPDEWTAYVTDDDGKPHAENAAILTRVLV